MDNTTPHAANRVFLRVEHFLYMALGAVLAVTAAAALLDVVYRLGIAVLERADSAALLSTVDRLLFVLMLAEILHTVRVSINSGSLSCEPFLIVGLIASIRRVLVITLQSSQAAGNGAEHASFENAMIELGVLCVLILVMVVSILIIRRASGGHDISTGVG